MRKLQVLIGFKFHRSQVLYTIQYIGGRTKGIGDQLKFMYIIKRSEDAGTSSLVTTAAFKGGRLYKVQK